MVGERPDGAAARTLSFLKRADPALPRDGGAGLRGDPAHRGQLSLCDAGGLVLALSVATAQVVVEGLLGCPLSFWLEGLSGRRYDYFGIPRGDEW